MGLCKEILLINFVICFVVVRVRFVEPEYIFREETGLSTVCLVKDLETAVSFEVNSITTQNSALGKILIELKYHVQGF